MVHRWLFCNSRRNYNNVVPRSNLHETNKVSSTHCSGNIFEFEYMGYVSQIGLGKKMTKTTC